MLLPSVNLLAGLLMLRQQVQQRPVLLDCLAAEAVDQVAAQSGARHGTLRVTKAILHVHHQERRFLGFDKHIHSILLFLSLRGIGAAMLAL